MAAACGRAASSSKIKLSKNLLEMKFMKKSKEKVETEQMQSEENKLLDHDRTECMKRTGSQFIIEPSFVPCEDLIFGRVSFKGQNPEIEKMMKEFQTERQSREIEEKEKLGTVSEEEMTDRYVNLIGTIAKKFSSKRQRQNDDSLTSSHLQQKRTKFMKPNE